MNKIKCKKLSDTATLPTYGSKKAACADIYADCPPSLYTYTDDEGKVCEGIKIEPHTTVKIHTGLSFQPASGYCGEIFARSGLSTKQGLRPANCVGVCDEDYTGEYIVALHNDSDVCRIVQHGDRIAQLRFVRYEQFEFEQVCDIEMTERGDNGFGSTGK